MMMIMVMCGFMVGHLIGTPSQATQVRTLSKASNYFLLASKDGMLLCRPSSCYLFIFDLVEPLE